MDDKNVQNPMGENGMPAANPMEPQKPAEGAAAEGATPEATQA